jgi:hypothetical protein
MDGSREEWQDSVGLNPIDLRLVGKRRVGHGARRPDADYRAETYSALDLDDPLKRRMTSYLLRCYRAEEKDFHEIEFKTPAGTWLNERLTRMLHLPLGEGDARVDIAKELAARLSDLMGSSGAPTVPGAIFLIQGKVDGKRYIALVKLDLERHEVVALRQAGEGRSLFSKVFEAALPEDPRRFRKAVLVPSPGEGDGRSGQFDGTSDYWQIFVGAEPMRDLVKATRAIIKTAHTVAEQEHLPLGEATLRTILKRVEAMKHPSPGGVAEVIKGATRVQKKVDKIEQELLRNLGRTRLAGATKVSAHVYRVLDGKVSFRIPAELIEAGAVRVKHTGTEVTFTFLNTELDRDDIVEH